MNKPSSLKEFYSSLNTISILNEDLDKKWNSIKKEVHSFHESIQLKSVDEEILKQNDGMADLLKESISTLKNASNTWVGNFELMLEKEKFRSDLANYFIIIIFGKVKAGKSSLGNFIARHKLPEHKVEFFKYDEAGKKQSINKLEEIESDSFDTNNLECTVEIQGFKLDGMAWIDTPGLGSMVKENGDLAKEYIQSADYIIYPTSSDSPLQQDEKEQLRELFEQGKKVTICITKSDEKEEDECDCGSEDGCSNCESGLVSQLKNKSAKNRAEQETYVNDEIRKNISREKQPVLGEIYSISAHTATKALKEDNEELFNESNMSKFYELITEVIIKKSAELKKDTPYDGLKSFIENDILGAGNISKGSSIFAIKGNLDQLDEKIAESIDRFNTLKENANNDLESEVENITSKFELKINKSNANEVFKEIDKELNKVILEIIQNNTKEIFKDFDTTLQKITTSIETDSFKIEDIDKDITYTTETRNKEIGSRIGGAVVGIAALVFAPVTGGTSLLVSTGAGAAGSYVGSKIGEVLASEHKEKIMVGDNKEEVIQRFKLSRLESHEKTAAIIYEQMQDAFFMPLEKTSKNIRIELEQFEECVTNIL